MLKENDVQSQNTILINVVHGNNIFFLVFFYYSWVVGAVELIEVVIASSVGHNWSFVRTPSTGTTCLFSNIPYEQFKSGCHFFHITQTETFSESPTDLSSLLTLVHYPSSLSLISVQSFTTFHTPSSWTDSPP